MGITRIFIRKFYEEQSVSLAGFLFNKGIQQHDLEDIVQECFLTFWTHRDKVRKGEERSYLFGIARNLVKAYHRRHANFSRLIDQIREIEKFNATTPENRWNPALLEEEDRDIVRSSLSRLPRKMAEVMRLLYLEDLPRETVAGRLGISVNTVYRQERRAKARLNRSGSETSCDTLEVLAYPKEENRPK